MVKRYGLFIGWIVLLVMAACHEPGKPRQDTSLPPIAASPVLAAIDSLTWQRPDSALVLLQDYFACRDAMLASPDAVGSNLRRIQCFSTNTDYNRHYAHLLLAELLYKNDYAQTNRADLRQVVAYFDSLLVADTRGVSLQWGGRRDARRATAKTVAFLDARAHYINGVGYYENDSVAEACKEYLKALETMEERFEEKELVGKRAKFMVYTYNRLGDMFSERFMMDPAIYCYKYSLLFSSISPISSYSIPSAMYRIGKQFNKKKEIDSAYYYYSQAIANMPDSSNLLYRDMVSSQALLSYQLTQQVGPAIKRLKQMVDSAEDYDEVLTRYLVFGYIYFEAREYDSAQQYLKSVFEYKNDVILQLQAAEYLCVLYDSLDLKDQADFYIRFLAMHKPMEYEANTKVSILSELFKNYLEKKQKRFSEREKREELRLSIKKTTTIIVPIAIAVALYIYITLKLKSKKLLKLQQAEANLKLQENEELSEQKITAVRQHHATLLEAERQIHLRIQAALSGRLKKKNQEVRDLKEQIKRQNETASPVQAASFADEPICRLIMEHVNEGKFLSQMNCSIYRDYALDKHQLEALRNAADRHFDQYTVRISKAFPSLTKTDIDYCCLYLLGLTDADVAALMQRAYNTVNERNSKLRRIFGSDNPISVTLKAIANKSIFI